MQDLLKLVAPDVANKTIKKRKVILYQGEVPRSAYIIHRGIVKAYNINSSGNEQIAAFYVANDLFPLTWIFDKTTSAIHYFEALTDCEVTMIDKEVLKATLAKEPALFKTILEYVMTNYTGALMRITALEQSKASEKVIFTLYYLAHRYGRELESGVFSVNLGLTQTTIADMVGLTRETTASELIKLKKLGVVSYQAKEYIINRKKLERLIGDDSFSAILR